MKKFFVGCNIDFENECERELKEVWPFLIDLDGKVHAEELVILDKVQGGILIEAPLHLGLQLNFFLKCANRVLLRIGEKKIRDFPALFQWFKKVSADPLLQNVEFDFSVTAKQSRLNNEKRILEVLQETFKFQQNSKQTLYVRFNDDLCTLSLDTTGELLHKRTDKHVGKAPLRETIAAFCIRRLINGASPADLAKVSLIDPMCGTGTLLLEARNLYQIKLDREFSFKLLKQTPKLLKDEMLAMNYQIFPKLFKKCIGFDIDKEVLDIANSTLSDVDREAFLFGVRDVSQAITDGDFGRSWVISNIPYGERIKTSLTADEIIEHIIDNYRPEKIGLLMSERQKRELKIQAIKEWGYELVGEEGFSNGGLRVSFLIFVDGEILNKEFHHKPEDGR